MLTTHDPVPLHAPVQPAKIEPARGVGVRVTSVPSANEALQVEPHEIPAGELDTEPAPVPFLPTVNV